MALKMRENQDLYNKVESIIKNCVNLSYDKEKQLFTLSFTQGGYGRTNRSLHFMNDYAAGHVILPKDIGVLRTEKELSVGISPEFLDEIIGKTLTHDVKSGQGVRFDHFMN